MANKDMTMNRLLNALDDNTRQSMRSLPSSEEALAMVYGTSVDNTQTDNIETEKVVMISLDDIVDHPKQVYRVEDNDEMQEIIQSIKDIGILSPILLTDTYGDYQLNGKYMCVSGHRRRFAARKAGLTKVPALVKSMSEDDADIILVSSNSQREDVLPSEKAAAYKIRYEALKRKAGRPSGNFVQVEQNLSNNHSIKIISEEMGVGQSTIQRFLRLNELMAEWLKAVDNYALGDKKDKSYPAIGLTTGVALSYLKKYEQQYVWQSCDANNMGLSLEMAETLKDLSGKLTLDIVDNLFFAAKNKNKKAKEETTLKFFSKPLMKKTDEFFPDDDLYKSPEVREQVMIEALAMYFESKGIKIER